MLTIAACLASFLTLNHENQLRHRFGFDIFRRTSLWALKWRQGIKGILELHAQNNIKNKESRPDFPVIDPFFWAGNPHQPQNLHWSQVDHLVYVLESLESFLLAGNEIMGDAWKENNGRNGDPFREIGPVRVCALRFGQRFFLEVWFSVSAIKTPKTLLEIVYVHRTLFTTSHNLNHCSNHPFVHPWLRR